MNNGPRNSNNTGQVDKTLDAQFQVNQFGETVAHFSTTTDGNTPDPKVLTSIGRYEIRGLLGRGGFGAVYHGYDVQLDREVAIKVPLLESKEEFQKLFLQEARQLAQLTHPSIVTVHDIGVDDGLCYIVSEFLAGTDLNHWLNEREITWQQAVDIAATILDALATAHALSTIHRDLKPANIIMTERADGSVPVIVDFGLAVSEANEASVVAQRGHIAGTPNYMSPEQALGEGHRIDGRTDIYAAGVILYRMLSGQLPFKAPSVSDLLQVVIMDEPRPPRQFVRDIPRELERICLKAMAKQITDRYTTAADMADELRALLKQHKVEIQQQQAAAKPKGQSATREATKILIADDHELSRFKLQNDLEKWGHEVTVAEDGEQAWELFQKGEYSIVITDWMMPKMNGLDLVAHIRGSNQADYVYVILLTAKSEKHDIVAGMGAGADDFLTKPFHRDELQVRLRAGIRITSQNRELNETNRRLQRSQEAAAQIQRSFLPTAKPQIAGYDFAWEHHSCGELGGDMLNVIELDEQHVGLYVLDVTGDGVPAALLATTLSRVMSPAADPQSLLAEHDEKSAACRLLTPIEVARKLNQQFGHQEGKQFFTFTYCVLNLQSRELRFASAGHTPLLHQQAGGSPAMLDVPGFPIGIDPDCDEFTEQAITLKSGDRVFVYSDGLTDTMNADGDIFGAAQLLEATRGSGFISLEQALRSLMAQLDEFRGSSQPKDDVSILAVAVE
jgi:serine/threonine protein kinase/serine phosphatase RsbU (regulator of sigma subunit)